MRTEIRPDGFAPERQAMVDWQLYGRGIRDQRVLDAMARVPRHEFVEERYLGQAYEDHPIPIGEGQTISQPYIVALTLEALSLQSSDTVLEIGTGSGYQAAVLAELSRHVYSIERQPSLARNAQATLARLGYANVSVSVGDGSQGLPALAPFDDIAVAAAAPQVPASLWDQLREGGRMVIPVGPPDAQELRLVRKHEGKPLITILEACRFVPLVGGQGYPSAW
jgi:protein-L-isoaspartate(D-aspartate) O-methyltransferase